MITDDDLAELQRDNAIRAGDAYATATEVYELAVELRALRALLATEIPCGWPEPVALEPGDSTGVHTIDYRAVQYGEHVYDPDEAIALGMALARAGLAAKGEKL